MDKVELEIVALSHSITQSHSYAIVLGEKVGVRRLPIVIGGAEAQAIAIALENMDHGRPLTHDLIKNIFDELGLTLKEVLINDLKDGIFYAQLICVDTNNDVYTIDSRTSDAMALAVRFHCPISTYEFILEQAGIIMDETVAEQQEGGEETRIAVPKAEKEKPSSSSRAADLTGVTDADLEQQMEDALKAENYELAAKIRDELNKRQGS